ncbi:MAG: SGNH/GDSL hydrolase family protein [Paramuribaculum sp.]|nr:SGNH/GDSL hydrolase family protein [Paramuribaculum sp.]
MRRLSVIILVFLFATVSSFASLKWIDPMDLDYPVVQNQGWSEELKGTYQRLPDRAKNNVRSVLWDLSVNSSGLAIYFRTNSSAIRIRYIVKGPLEKPHIPKLAMSGVDLYRIASNGTTHEFCSGNYSFGDTISFQYDIPVLDDDNAEMPEYRLNLPLYNTISKLEIGVNEDASINVLPVRDDKPIVLYGTSIAHGAGSPRPGMSWPNIMRRNLNDYPVINLGFAANGRLEPELIDLLCEIDASIYILDCMPNMELKTGDEISSLVEAAVKTLRANSKAPILLVEHAGYSNAQTDPSQFELANKINRNQRKVYDRLQNEGFSNLYYLTKEELNFPADSWVDYVHPNAIGASRQAAVVTKRIEAIVPSVTKYCNR